MVSIHLGEIEHLSPSLLPGVLHFIPLAHLPFWLS